MGTEALVLFLRSYREPVLAELGHPDVASGRYGASGNHLQTAQRETVFAIAPTGRRGAAYFLRA